MPLCSPMVLAAGSLNKPNMDNGENRGRNEELLALRNRIWPSLACRAICRLFFRHVVRIIKYVVES
jgi:hypothetical protein